MWMMQYKGSPFKIAKFSRWVVVVSGPQAIEDYRQVPDDDLTMLNLSTEEVCVKMSPRH
jgi:hypothetical protein